MQCWLVKNWRNSHRTQIQGSWFVSSLSTLQQAAQTTPSWRLFLLKIGRLLIKPELIPMSGCFRQTSLLLLCVCFVSAHKRTFECVDDEFIVFVPWCPQCCEPEKISGSLYFLTCPEHSGRFRLFNWEITKGNINQSEIAPSSFDFSAAVSSNEGNI